MIRINALRISSTFTTLSKRNSSQQLFPHCVRIIDIFEKFLQSKVITMRIESNGMLSPKLVFVYERKTDTVHVNDETNYGSFKKYYVWFYQFRILYC